MTTDTEKDRYDPKQYWAQREHPNTAVDPGISQEDKRFLVPRIAGARSIIEIGPGVGRLFPLYQDVPRIHTLDLSTNYRDRARASARRAELVVIDNYLDDPLAPFPYSDGEFDIGVTSHVLMHVPFENIEHTMREAGRICRRVLVISAYHRYWPKPGAPFDPKWHCFSHDYEAICAKIGYRYSDYTLFTQRELDGSFGFSFTRT